MGNFIKPSLLKSGDKIALIAPAGFVEADYIDKSIALFESWGLEVHKGKHLMSRYNQFAGTDEQRLFDLQQALESEDVKAVFCARGGYGTLRILDKINWHKFIENPKWLVGFSDITTLHFAIHSHGIQSLHAAMPINFKSLDAGSKPIEMLRQALTTGLLEYNLESNMANRLGTEVAPIIGGNLTLIHGLASVLNHNQVENKILFIEEVGEELYHVDRMMQSLRLSGMLDRLSGIIVGGFTEMRDEKRPFGKSYMEIITEAIGKASYPVVFDFPAGHQNNNLPLIFGAETALEVTVDNVKIKFE